MPAWLMAAQSTGGPSPPLEKRQKGKVPVMIPFGASIRDKNGLPKGAARANGPWERVWISLI